MTMRKTACFGLFVAVLLLSACGAQNAPQNTTPETDALPEVHAIAYPDDYPTAHDEYGASAFAGTLNHPVSRYYAVNDSH